MKGRQEGCRSPEACLLLSPPHRLPAVLGQPQWILLREANSRWVVARLRSLQCTNFKVPFGRQKMPAPRKDVHFLIPRILHGKKEIAGLIKLSILGWEGYPGLVEGAPYNKQEAGRSKADKM